MTRYATLEQANEYHNARPSALAWNALSDEQKLARLVSASDYIDTMYRFKGHKTNPHQTRQFPRNGQNQIPNEVIWACCELAGANNGTGNLNAKTEAQRSSVRVGEIQVSYDTSQSSTQKASLYPFVDGFLRDWIINEELVQKMGAILVGRKFHV